MTAEQALRDGNLDGALAEVKQKVRSEPSEAKHRIFLFQLMAVQGDWERALTQLNVIGDLDPGALAMVQAYREALRCEALRADVFRGRHTPLVFGEPAAWIALLLQAQRLSAEGRHAESATLRDEAFEGAPASAGTLDGEPFEWIADADPRLGPVLEAIINGRYYWVPFANIRQLKIEAPADLRDFVWMPAFFTWANGGEAPGLIPTRYPGSEASDDPLIRLARRTDWIEQAEELYFGAGQRMLATEAGERALMDVREITLEAGGEDSGGAPGS